MQDALDCTGTAHTNAWTLRLVPRFVASAGEDPRYVIELCQRFSDGWHLGYLTDTQGLRRTFVTLDEARDAARAFLTDPKPTAWRAASRIHLERRIHTANSVERYWHPAPKAVKF